MLRQRPPLLVPRFVEHGLAKPLGGRSPGRSAGAEPEPASNARRPVKRDLAHRGGVGEHPSFDAYLPNALVWLAPCDVGSIGERSQSFPQPGVDRPAVRDPQVRAVEHFSVHVVLALVGGAVAPPHRRGCPIPLELGILPLVGHLAVGDLVHDPRRARALEGVEHPAEEPADLVFAPDAAQRPHRERRVPNPGVSVVPVAHTADRGRDRRGRRRHQRPVGPVVARLQRDRGASHKQRLGAVVGVVAHPGAPRNPLAVPNGGSAMVTGEDRQSPPSRDRDSETAKQLDS